MKHKKGVLFLLFMIISITIYLILYNRTYRITVKADNVYEIRIQTAQGFGLDTKTITNAEEIKDFMGEVHKIRFTHPKFDTGKGWVTAVRIKSRNKSGSDNVYSYTILGDKLKIGSIQYKIISQ
jgi:hypothetical protein